MSINNFLKYTGSEGEERSLVQKALEADQSFRTDKMKVQARSLCERNLGEKTDRTRRSLFL